jgi:hypothetical protein
MTWAIGCVTCKKIVNFFLYFILIYKADTCKI